MTRPFGYNCLSRRTAAIYSSFCLSRICNTVRKNGQRSYVSKRSLARKRSLPEQNEKSHQEKARPQASLVARKPQVLPEAVKTSGPLKSRARQNIIPFRAQLGVIRGRTEQLVATLQERTALWNSIQQDVRENRRNHREGNLVPFAYPEHAHAAYESLLESLDSVLRRYRSSYGEMLAAFEFLWWSRIGRQHPDHRPRKDRMFENFKILRQQRAESVRLTSEVKDLAKITHSIITRDALFFEHVTRLTAFKQNFHTVLRGWDGIKRALYVEGDQSTHWVKRMLPLPKINRWRAEVTNAKANVKAHLDKQLSTSNPPLFHMKRAMDFFHSLMRSSGSTLFQMEDIALFYQTESRKWPPYRTKFLWISACLDTWRTHNVESGNVFRSVAFYIAAHVRHKYGLISSNQSMEHLSRLPLYVLHGLAIEEHRAARSPVPYPKLRPGPSGIFPEVHIDEKGYPRLDDLWHMEEIGGAIEVPELVTLEDTPQVTTIKAQDHAPGRATSEDTDDQQDAEMLWDDYDLPDVDDVSFPSPHDRVQSLHYGQMLRQRKATLESIRSHPEEHMRYSHLDAVATYATLFREQAARINEQNLNLGPSSSVVTSPTVLAVPEAWQTSYRRRSRLRPKKYGDMLRQFQGLPPSTDTVHEPAASSRAQARSHIRSATVTDFGVAESPQVLTRVEDSPASTTDPDYSGAPIRSALGSVLDDFLFPDARARIRKDGSLFSEERTNEAGSPLIRRYESKKTTELPPQDAFSRRDTVPAVATSLGTEAFSPISKLHSTPSPVVDAVTSSTPVMQGHTPMPPAVSPLRKQLDTLHLHIEGLIKIKLELEKLHAEETQPVVLTADSHVVSASPLEPRDEAASVPAPEDLYDTHIKRRAARRRRDRARDKYEAEIPQEPVTESGQEDDLLGNDMSSTGRGHRHDIPPGPVAGPEQESGLHDSLMFASRGQVDAASVPHSDGPRVTRTLAVARRRLAPNVVYHCPNCFGSNPMTNISCDKCGAALSLAAADDEVRRAANKYWALKNARSAKHSAQRTQPSFEGLFEQELSRRNTAAAGGVVTEGDETRDG